MKPIVRMDLTAQPRFGLLVYGGRRIAGICSVADHRDCGETADAENAGQHAEEVYKKSGERHIDLIPSGYVTG